MLQAVPLPDVGRQPTLRLALLQEVRLIRFVIPYLFSGRGLGLSPAAWFSMLRSHSMLFTLLRPLSLPGLPGGFQVAATGYEKVSTCEVHPILMAVRNIHVVALWRPWFLLRDEAEKSATHDGSACGLVSGIAVRFGFALRPSFGLRKLFCCGSVGVQCVLVKWLCWVSVGPKIHAESSSNGSSRVSLAHLRTSHDQNFVVCLGSGSLLTLRRPCGQLLRQRQSCSLQALWRILCSLLRQRQNDPVRVGGTY